MNEFEVFAALMHHYRRSLAAGGDPVGSVGELVRRFGGLVVYHETQRHRAGRVIGFQKLAGESALAGVPE